MYFPPRPPKYIPPPAQVAFTPVAAAPIDYRMFAIPPPPPSGNMDQQGVVSDDDESSIGFNSDYPSSALGVMRAILILSMMATVIASALIVNRDWAVRQENSYDVSVWLSTLIFACVGLAMCLLVFLIYLFNLPNLPGCSLTLCNILFAVFDLIWFPAMFVLGAFCAKREAENHADFRNMSLNQGAFGVTAAFSMLSGLLFLVSALIGFTS